MAMGSLLITNIGLLATPLGGQALRGEAQGEIKLLADAAVAIKNKKIVYVGPLDMAPQTDEVIDAEGRLMTPGLIDCHTHLVFGGWRQQEFVQRLKGVPYLDILAGGGGILSTTNATRAASYTELFDAAAQRLAEMLHFGVTTCEAKSGYGLDLVYELEQLRVVKALDKQGPVELVSTFLGAHALPAEWADDRAGYLDLIRDVMIPLVAHEGLARYCDVFCETGVFSVAEARRVLLAARGEGLGLKIHADEIDCVGGSQLAGELGATSAEHLVASGAAEIAALAAGGVIGVLLPATSLFLGKPFAPARAMLDAGMAVAVGTDFNPGSSPCNNLPLCMSLACLGYDMTPVEVLCAVTLNAAAAVGQAERLGSIEVGKQADLVLWDAPDLEFVMYRLGANLVHSVVKKGRVVVG